MRNDKLIYFFLIDSLFFKDSLMKFLILSFQFVHIFLMPSLTLLLLSRLIQLTSIRFQRELDINFSFQFIDIIRKGIILYR